MLLVSWMTSGRERNGDDWGELNETGDDDDW